MGRGILNSGSATSYMKNFCELMAEVGEWNEALACAPAVSLEFWRSLVEKRATQLASESDVTAIPLLVAANRFESQRCSLVTRHPKMQTTTRHRYAFGPERIGRRLFDRPVGARGRIQENRSRHICHPSTVTGCASLPPSNKKPAREHTHRRKYIFLGGSANAFAGNVCRALYRFETESCRGHGCTVRVQWEPDACSLLLCRCGGYRWGN